MDDYKELIEFYEDAESYELRQVAKAIKQLVKERDAAIADLSEFRVCKTCKSLHDGICTKLSCSMCSKWEWRGVQE